MLLYDNVSILNSHVHVFVQTKALTLYVFVLIFFQTEVQLRAQVPQTGRYMFIVHYCQPEHTTFPVEVLLDSGEVWKGENA